MVKKSYWVGSVLVVFFSVTILEVDLNNDIDLSDDGRRGARGGCGVRGRRGSSLQATKDRLSLPLVPVSPLPRTPRRPCAMAPQLQPRSWCRSFLNVDLVPEELLGRVLIAAIDINGIARRPLVPELIIFAPGMNGVETLASWSTDPSTLPRADG